MIFSSFVLFACLSPGRQVSFVVVYRSYNGKPNREKIKCGHGLILLQFGH